MVDGNLPSVTARLKREECKRTKHDSNFSDWQILIGPSDWEDYSKGKEGSSRYRIHNLPEKSGPGVYELGIAVSRTHLGRKLYKLEPDCIVVVYLGQADNVRTRLQHYGRTGAHLGNSYSVGYPDDCSDASHQTGQGLFEEIFSQGYPIIYRWAPMKNKEAAKQTESQLLNIFDYAWNTSNNGTRRPDDIIQKLNKIASGTRRFLNLARVLLPFTQKQVGIRIKSDQLPEPSPDDNLHQVYPGSFNFLARVFKLNRSCPRKVQDVTSVIQENAKICEVALVDGSVCRRPPAERRKRCSEHKGMRANGSNGKTIRAIRSENIVDLEPNCQRKDDGYGEQNVSHNLEEPPQTAVENPIDESFKIICGIILNDGSPCRKEPVKGRKRCHEHKGKRIHSSTYKLKVVENSQLLHGVFSESYASMNSMQKTSAMHKLENVKDQAYTKNPVSNYKSYDMICGVDIGDGFCCTRQPVRGRVRCEEHKGKRTGRITSKIVAV